MKRILFVLAFFVLASNSFAQKQAMAGAIVIINYTKNPYIIYLNGREYKEILGSSYILAEKLDPGSYIIRAVQRLGYKSQPKQYEQDINVVGGQLHFFTFP